MVKCNGCRCLRDLVRVVLVVWSLMLACRDSVAEGLANPGEQIVATVEELRRLVVTKKDKVPVAELDRELHDSIEPHFDFFEMSKRSLGPNWNEITPAEQQEFSQLFGELLARAYLIKIRRSIESSSLQLIDQKVAGQLALVRTRVNDGKDDVQIEYRCRTGGGDRWRIYDVIIENIGIISTYRDQFADIIKKEKFPGLMAKLRDKQISVSKS